MTARPPRVWLVVVATGRYHEFLPALISGASAYVVGLERIFVVSDSPPSPHEMVTWLPWGHLPWPYPTLLRYRAMTAYQDVLRGSEVLLYLDVDMRIERPIELPPMKGIFAVRHPGYVGVEGDELPYERRVESTSCVPLGEGTSYYAGGVQGGHNVAYLQACSAMAGWIQADLARGVVPLWHDESAWNRYCMLNTPELELPSGYCSPEYQEATDAFIVALDKNHDRLRETPFGERLARRCQATRRRIVRNGRRVAKILRPSR